VRRWCCFTRVGRVSTRAPSGQTLGPLAARFHVYSPERRGHGHTPDVDGPITFDAMAQDTIAFLETVVGGPAHLVGCSDGATVALLVALRRPWAGAALARLELRSPRRCTPRR
jgi:pimeloyl-ACP methyl ester carboxylesterase